MIKLNINIPLAKTFWRMYSKNYGKYRSHTMIGDMSYLIRKYQSTTHEDFFEKYINDREDGRSFEYVSKIADSLSFSTGENYNTCLNAIIYSIVSIVDGYAKEVEIKNRLQKAHPDWVINDPSATQDRMGIDLIVNDKYYIQVKPLSFFCGDSNQGLVRDRLTLIKYMNIMDKPLLIALYNDGEVIGHLFTIYQLMDSNGHSNAKNINEIKQGHYETLMAEK